MAPPEINNIDMLRISKFCDRHLQRNSILIKWSKQRCISSATAALGPQMGLQQCHLHHDISNRNTFLNRRVATYSMLMSPRCFHGQRILRQEEQQEQSQLLVIDMLREAVKNGAFVHDPNQEKTAQRLSNLQKALVGYSNEALIQYIEEMEKVGPQKQKTAQVGNEVIAKYSIRSKGKNDGDLRKFGKNDGDSAGKPNDRDEEELRGGSQSPPDKPPMLVPRGLFIHGNVGTGKTQLMDIFYNSSSVLPEHRKRVHFHSFMQDVHKRIHNLKKEDLETYGRNFSIDLRLDRNPIKRVAIQLASETRLLCFDEFQVTDVADALILSQLFQELFQRGTVVVATSNRHPETLYEGGLNRSYFLPFIDLLCRHCIVHDMNHDTDYRIVTTEGSESYFFPKTCEDSLKHYMELVSSDNTHEDEIIRKDVKVDAAFRRVVNVPEVRVRTVADGTVEMARFHFRDLCNTELGSSDYRAVAQNFKVVVIDDIPLLTLKDHNQARRFITLIDELYEANCALICSTMTADSPDTLFRGREEELAALGRDAQNKKGVETKAGEAFGIDVAQSNGLTAGGLASVQELSFAFKRAASRIKEMTSKNWLEKHGIAGFE
jgi:protein AFG1